MKYLFLDRLFFTLEINNLTYDVWNFVLLVAEPLFRPLVYLTFYLTFIINNDNVYWLSHLYCSDFPAITLKETARKNVTVCLFK